MPKDDDDMAFKYLGGLILDPYYISSQTCHLKEMRSHRTLKLYDKK